MSEAKQDAQLARAARWLVECGMEVDEPVIDSPGIQRVPHSCRPNSKKKNGWYILHSSPVLHGSSGCWACGDTWTFRGTGRALTDDEKLELRQMHEQRLREQTEAHDAVARKVEKAIGGFAPASPDNSYLQAKGIPPCGARESRSILFLPLRDVDGRIWSCQGIAAKPQRILGHRTKSFETGGRTAGCFFAIGVVDQADRLIVCEGFATGATLHSASGIPVACAMSASNLEKVAVSFRKKHPQLEIIIAGDNDRHTEGNPGATSAQDAGCESNAEVILPDFGDIPPSSDATDFNDLARLRGIEVVAEAVRNVRRPPRVDVVYEAWGGGRWYSLDARGDYVPVSLSAVVRWLKANGLTNDKEKGVSLSPLDHELNRLIHAANVAYAGPVAGWPAGRHQMCGKQVLVTSGIRPLSAKEGPFDTLSEFLRNMLGDEQMFRLSLWLHYARRRFGTRIWHPLPALVLVGPRSCGKSLLQHIITLLLGGRSARPAQFLQGTTPFNADLFGAEHLVMEDESAKCDNASRRHLGEQLKAMLFTREVRCHPKGQQPISLEPIWALSMSLNDEPEHLMVLPPIDDSLRDKLLLLRCEHRPRAVPAGRDESEWLNEVLQRELPHFAHHLDHFPASDAVEDFTDPRTKVAGWQNPTILRVIADLAPETQLLALIDDTLFAGSTRPFWRGTSQELSRELRSGSFGPEAQNLLSWSNACGTYLGRLAKAPDPRVKGLRTSQARTWEITAPAKKT